MLVLAPCSWGQGDVQGSATPSGGSWSPKIWEAAGPRPELLQPQLGAASEQEWGRGELGISRGWVLPRKSVIKTKKPF